MTRARRMRSSPSVAARDLGRGRRAGGTVSARGCPFGSTRGRKRRGRSVLTSVGAPLGRPARRATKAATGKCRSSRARRQSRRDSGAVRCKAGGRGDEANASPPSAGSGVSRARARESNGPRVLVPKAGCRRRRDASFVSFATSAERRAEASGAIARGGTLLTHRRAEDPDDERTRCESEARERTRSRAELAVLTSVGSRSNRRKASWIPSLPALNRRGSSEWSWPRRTAKANGSETHAGAPTRRQRTPEDVWRWCGSLSREAQGVGSRRGPSRTRPTCCATPGARSCRG